jgi:hypothetical protein
MIMQGENMNKNRFFFLKSILLHSILSYFFLILIYPDFFLTGSIRFTSSHTVANSFQAALMHTKYVNNLNFEFWSFYDQSNHTFTHLAQGFHTFLAIIEAFFYNLFSFFSSSNFFQIYHSVFSQFICIFFRTVGIVLILDLYKTNKFLYFILITSINVLISSIINIGYEAGWLYSLLPILIYYLIVFLKKNNIVPLIFFLVFYIFAFSQSPLLAMGYFFLPFHFIFTIYILFFFYNFFFRKNLIFNSAYANFFDFNIKLNRFYYLLIISIIVIILFNFSYFLILNKTYALTGSLGYYGIEESRFDRIFNPVKYFKSFIVNFRCVNGHNPAGECSTFGLLTYLLNFKNNEWYHAPAFIGSSVVLISLIGLIFSKNYEKWYFALVVVYIVALQGPRDVLFFDINFYANLINAFLNPFSFLIQHTHMTLLMLPFFLMPLFIMGTNFIYEKMFVKKNLYKVFIFFLINILILTYVFKINLENNVIFLYFIIFAILFLILLLGKKNLIKKIKILLIAFCFLLDSYALKIYLNNISFSGERIGQIKVDIPNRPGSHFIDFPNPKISENSFEFLQLVPKITKLNSEETSTQKKSIDDLYFSRQLYIGEFYKKIFFWRYLEKPIIYELRPKIYSDIHFFKDTKYFKSQLNFFNYYLDSIDTGSLNYLDFLENSEYFDNYIYLSNYKKDFFKKSKIYKEKDFEYKNIKINNKDITVVKKDNYKTLYKFKLSEEIPNYINSSIFSDKDSTSLFVNNKKLTLTQGDLKEVNTFNINYVSDRYVYFYLINNLTPSSINLSFLNFPLIKTFHRKGDSFSFNLEIPNTGWLLLKFPFDSNWTATVDGKKIEIHNANKFWTGFKFEKGNHTLELKYSLSKYLINNLTLLLYFISMTYILVFLFLFNRLINKSKKNI